MSARGSISRFNTVDRVGRIVLDDGREVRFGESACVGFRPEVGMVVWVAEIKPHVLGGLKAVSIHANAEGRHSNATLRALRSEKNAELASRLAAEVAPALDEAAVEPLPPVADVLSELGVDWRTDHLGQIGEAFGFCHRPTSLVAWVPFDPCFVALGNLDTEADAYCLFVYPGSNPDRSGQVVSVVKWLHDDNPERLASDIDSFLWKLAKSQRRKDALRALGIEPARSSRMSRRERALIECEGPDLTEQERAERSLIGSGLYTDEAEPLRRAIDFYRSWSWPESLIRRAEAQLRLHVDGLRATAEEAKIRLEHWERHPDIYAEELREHSTGQLA